MRTVLIVSAVGLAAVLGCSSPKSRILYPSSPPSWLDAPGTPSETILRDFDRAEPGRLPAGWRIAETKSNGTPAVWTVVADPSAPSPPNVLAITETLNTGGTFNLTLAETTEFTDLDLSVRLKALAGKEDQGGGVVWRAIDADNYYVCRVNPLESNFRVYKVIAGKRQQLATADTTSKTGEWHQLRVVMRKDHIECFLDGSKLLEARDQALPKAGMIGLWTKADAATAFDDLAVRPLD